MNRKLTPAEKGSEAPRRARVRVQEPDLLQKHSLTLIGKVTNPSVQKVPSLIPFFTNHWKTNEIRTVGSDLGQGLFQFQFDSESDLLAVLENRPYHFAKWMVILQRWESTISPSFPSLIPFWIKVEGIPAHLWTEETIRSIGEDIGRFECSDIISTLSVRMRVHVNGRLPLIKSSVIEYPNGDEVRVSLVYEKLEKHCSHCYRLDHELKDCLAAKHQKKKKANALAGVSLTRELLATLESFLPATSKPESRQTVPQYNGGEALPQVWHRDSQTVVHDASNQLYAAGQLPPPPCYYLSGGNMYYTWGIVKSWRFSAHDTAIRTNPYKTKVMVRFQVMSKQTIMV